MDYILTNQNIVLVKIRRTGHIVSEMANSFHINPDLIFFFFTHENNKLHSKNKQGLSKTVLYPFNLRNSLFFTARESIMNSNSSGKVKVAEKVLITSPFELIFLLSLKSMSLEIQRLRRHNLEDFMECIHQWEFLL